LFYIHFIYFYIIIKRI